MYCNNCGHEIKPNFSFCGNCGNKVEKIKNQNLELTNSNNISDNVVDVSNTNSNAAVNNLVSSNNVNNNSTVNAVLNNNLTSNVPNINNNVTSIPPNINNNFNTNMGSNNKKNNTVLIVILLIVIIALIIMVCFFIFNDDKSLTKDDDGKTTGENINYDDDDIDDRTILIYLCGSSLESEMALGTSDLKSISSLEIDLETTNVVVYTGGAKKWHNYISNSENAIYVLEEDGFVKKKTYSKASMGTSDSLTTLLDYGFKNYGADKYDLIMWNHGLGALGISQDELYQNDFLDLNELTKSLEKSNFTGKNKFETVVFRSCLNATLEMATVFEPYAKYFVASEEVSWGMKNFGIFGFLSDIDFEDSGLDFGKKYIKSYFDALEKFEQSYGSYKKIDFGKTTYSIIDLSKIDDVQESLNNFVKDIDLDSEYNRISKVRSNLYQYATNADYLDFDTVDLYSLISGLRGISSTNANKVLESLDDAIVYNFSNDSGSNGLAIYFPYNGKERIKDLHYSSYKNLGDLDDYYSFIKEFDSIKSLANDDGFSIISKADVEISVNNKKVTLGLNDENKDNYVKASYLIFEKNSDGSFKRVYTSNTFELGKSLYTMNLDKSLIKVIGNNSSTLLDLRENDGTYSTNVTLINDSEKIDAQMSFNLDDDVSISNIVIPTSTGMLLDIEDFSKVIFVVNNYNVLKNETVNDDWHSLPVSANVELSDYKFEKVSLDENYYIMFKIYDVDNLFTYSDLVQIK